MDKIKKILCISCNHCKKWTTIDDIIMWHCDIFDLFVLGVVNCPDYEKEIRDKIVESQEESK